MTTKEYLELILAEVGKITNPDALELILELIIRLQD